MSALEGRAWVLRSAAGRAGLAACLQLLHCKGACCKIVCPGVTVIAGHSCIPHTHERMRDSPL